MVPTRSAAKTMRPVRVKLEPRTERESEVRGSGTHAIRKLPSQRRRRRTAETLVSGTRVFVEGAGRRNKQSSGGVG